MCVGVPTPRVDPVFWLFFANPKSAIFTRFAPAESRNTFSGLRSRLQKQRERERERERKREVKKAFAPKSE
jgi:hypothetical protein